MSNGLTKILEEIGIKNFKSIFIDEVQGYYIGVALWQDRKVIIKIGKTAEHLDRFVREKNISDVIKKGNSIIEKKFLTTNALVLNKSVDCFWIIREFCEGTPLGKIPKVGDPFFSHPVEDEFILRKSDFLAKIVDNVLALQGLNVANEIEANPKRFGILERQSLPEIERIAGINLNKALKFYDKHKDRYYDLSYTRPCTCDLTPANIIVDRERLVFLDLEWLSLENLTIDFAYLWLFLWEFPLWQKEIARIVLQRENFSEEFFRVSILRIIVYWYTRLLGISEKREEKLEVIKNHIWTSYLNNLEEIEIR